MRLRRNFRFLMKSGALSLGLALVGCAPAEPGSTPGTGGSSSSGGAAVPGSGGAASGGATVPGTGGASSGGAPATGGTSVPGSGGASSGGASNPGSGGAATGGRGGGTGSRTGGSTGTGTGGSSSTGSGGSGNTGTPMPSAGCGKSGRPSGGMVMVANDHIYTFPATYDGMKPFPLYMGFHACGNPIDQFINLSKGSAIETEYVRAVPRSSDSGGCWSYNTDIPRVLKVYDDLMANYCIDMNRIYASGHSSGAQMIVQILTHKSDAEHMHWKAVAPVAASDYGAIQLAVPVMYIQGKMDSVRGQDGASTVGRFRTANGCMSTSTPYSQVMGCSSGGTQVNPGCIEYAGCKVPTVWCSHNDPNYSGTSHGVPCFAMKAMHDFFQSLP